VIAFDADDTLWQNETFYRAAQKRFFQVMEPYYPVEVTEERLYRTEIRNLPKLGYGIKAFALSMVETAIEMTNGEISGKEIGVILEEAHKMLELQIELLEDVEQVLESLAKMYPLMLITKGDLLDQEGKINRSGLAHYFKYIEIVSNKDEPSYQRILERHSISPGKFLMIGNSIRSDILPVLKLGGKSVYIPHPLTWQHEHASHPSQDGFYHLDRISQLVPLVKQLSNSRDK
jgi:putative hydrolase of the HAD superfamily